MKLLLTLAFLFSCTGKVALAQEHAPLKVTRLYTGEDGLSHFEQVSVKVSAIPGAPNTVEESSQYPWRSLTWCALVRAFLKVGITRMYDGM
jgi:hypothetical protein